MKTTFEYLCESTPDIIEKAINHPFNMDLKNGVLHTENFFNFLKQDALYLKDYAEALTQVIQFCNNRDHINDLIAFKNDTLAMERSLINYFVSFNNHYRFFQPANRKDPYIDAYSRHILRTTSQHPVEVGLASLTPCFWLYYALGQDMSKNDHSKNPYQKWIHTYNDPLFTIAYHKFIAIINSFSPNEIVLKKMIAAFQTSAQYELEFWNSIYKPFKCDKVEEYSPTSSPSRPMHHDIDHRF
jgi:thiaminase/transcriptional activator TenA